MRREVYKTGDRIKGRRIAAMTEEKKNAVTRYVAFLVCDGDGCFVHPFFPVRGSLATA